MLEGYLRPIWGGHDKWIEDQLLQILRYILVSIRKGTGKARIAQSQDELLWKLVSFLPLRSIRSHMTTWWNFEEDSSTRREGGGLAK